MIKNQLRGETNSIFPSHRLNQEKILISAFHWTHCTPNLHPQSSWEYTLKKGEKYLQTKHETYTPEEDCQDHLRHTTKTQNAIVFTIFPSLDRER